MTDNMENMTTTTSPKYPDIEIQLTGEDGNAFSIMGRVRRAMYRSGLGDTEWGDYHAEATSGSYDHLLMTTMKWFDCR
jgi:hypothetical protein